MRKLKVLKGILLFWCLFIGLGAMVGGGSMLIAPDGSILHMQAMLPYFAVLPFSDVLFQDYIFSGIMLIIVNGISNLIASFLLIKNKKAGFVLGTIFGFTLMLWITIQFIIFPPNILDCCCCSVTKLCLPFCSPMDCSTPGFSVLHYLPEFAQTHIH